MPKSFKEIRMFNKGTIRSGDETDIPEEAASYSLNIDSNSESGLLKGSKSEASITKDGIDDDGTSTETAITVSASISGSNTKGDVSGIINNDGKHDLVYYNGNDNTLRIVGNVFKGQGSTDSTTEVADANLKKGSYRDSEDTIIAGEEGSVLANVSDITAVESNNKALHIGMSSGGTQWVGVVKHQQFGHYQSIGTDGTDTGTDSGTSNGIFKPILQSSKLNSPADFPTFHWIVHSVDGYIYAAEWDGHYIHRFRYEATDDHRYTYVGEGSFYFEKIRGIAARVKFSGETGEGGVWVYDIGQTDGNAAHGTIYEYFVGGDGNISNNYGITDVNYTTNNADTHWDISRVGGIGFSYQTSGNGGDATLFIYKYLEQESIVNQDSTDTSGHYKQKSFLWRSTVKMGDLTASGTIVLINNSPRLISDIENSREDDFWTYQGFDNIYITNPANDDLDRNTGEYIGGNGLLQGGSQGDKNDMLTGFHTAKHFAQQGKIPIDSEDDGENEVVPKFKGLKCDPWPGTAWHSKGYTDSGVMDADEKLTKAQYMGDTLGLMFGFYSNDDSISGKTGGVTVIGYHKGKGYWTDSNQESSAAEGRDTDIFGNIDASVENTYGTDPTTLRATGALYNSDKDSDSVELLDITHLGAKEPQNDSSFNGVGCLDTNIKRVFWSIGYYLYSAKYSRTGVLSDRTSVHMNGTDALDGHLSEKNLFSTNSIPGGQHIDTLNKVIFFGTHQGGQIGAVSYDEDGNFSDFDGNGNMHYVNFHDDIPSPCSSIFHNNEKDDGIADLAIDPINKMVHCLCYNQIYDSTTPANGQFGTIVSFPYAADSSNPQDFGRLSESDFTGEALTAWYLLQKDDVTGFPTRYYADATTHAKSLAMPGVTDWLPKGHFDDEDEVPVGTICLDTEIPGQENAGLMFYTGTTSNGGYNSICITRTGNGHPLFNHLQSHVLGTGAGIGFKVDPVNKVLYGSCEGLGIWTAKYDFDCNLKLISNIKNGKYGATNSWGSYGGTDHDFTSSTFRSTGDAVGSSGGSGDAQNGSRCVQLAVVNQYHSENGQDDSYCTSAMLFAAFNENTSGASDATRESIIAGSFYNYLVDRIEIPKNAIYSSNTVGSIGLLLRVNGHNFGHSGNPETTKEDNTDINSNVDGNYDGGCYGNTCGTAINNTDRMSATWVALLIPVDEVVSSGYIETNSQFPFGPGGAGLAYANLAGDQFGNDSTEMKDRSKRMWTTPHSVDMVTIDSSDTKALVISQGDGNRDGVNSIYALKDYPGYGGITNDQDSVSDPVGIVAIGTQDTNPLLNRFAQVPRVFDTGHSGTNNSGGLINLFKGEGVGGSWYTLPITSSAIDTTFTTKFAEISKMDVTETRNTAGDTVTGSGYDPSEDGINSSFNVFYKLSFLYDGFQEGPLSEPTIMDIVEKCNVKIKITFPQTSILRTDFARASHVKIYRATNRKLESEDPQPLGHYRFIKQLKLTGENFFPKRNEDDELSWTAEFVDSNRASYSYESFVGISEAITDSGLNYGVSTQVNNFHIVGKAFSPIDTDIADNILFKSQAYTFDQFNILSDRLMVPFTPTALKSYQGRVYAFDSANISKIEPNQFYIEDTFEGIGCISPKTVITTEYGMFFADESNIYMHDGRSPKIISHPIQGGTYAWNNSKDDASTSPTGVRIKNAGYEVMAFDSRTHTVLVFFVIIDDVTTNTELTVDAGTTNKWCYAWGYNLLLNRWDLHRLESAAGVHVVKGFTSPDGYANLILSDSSLKVWGGNRTDANRKSWYWHSKDIDFGGRTLKKKLSKVKVSGEGTTLGGTVGTDVSDAHPAVSTSERIVLETDGTEVEGTSNYITKQTADNTDFRAKGLNSTGKRFKLKLEKQTGKNKISGIGLVHRVKGYR